MNHKIKYLLFFALISIASAVSAQSRRISGNVWNKTDGPVMMANVIERDPSNRIIEATVTDINGNFTMTIKNPKNILEVSFVGYKTERVSLSGTQTRYKIELLDANIMAAVDIVAKKVTKSGGLTIPEREVSIAQQSLDMDDLAGLSFTSADEALQGQIAGLDITANSGNLGSGTSMRLRGVSTINGNAEPLIVVDGNIFDLPSDASNISFDSSTEDLEEQFSTLLSVNPEDIQKINVLKDASASAIWGARGANGVIEITTRRGARGKTKIDFSYRFTGTWQPEGYTMLDGDGYTMMLKEAYFNPKQSTAASNMVELNYDQSRPMYYHNYNKNTDWVDAVTQFGQRHNYYVTLSGGGEKANFRVSGGYDSESGSIIKQSLDRFTTRMALDYFVSDRIKFSSTFGLAFTDNLRNYSNILNGAYNSMPNMTIYENDQYGNPTGSYFKMWPRAASAGSTPDGYSSFYLNDMINNGNPVAIANEAWKTQKTYRMQPQFQLDYKLLGRDDTEHQLNYTGEVYMDIYNSSDTDFYPASLTSGAWTSGVNKASNSEYKSFGFTTRHKLHYLPQLANQDHSVQLFGMMEVITGNSSNQSLSTSGLPTGVEDPTADSFLSGLGTSTGQWRSMAFVGQAHYSYKEGRYSLTSTVRADGSTKFGAGNKWGVFPGFSGRWNIIDEPFMQNDFIQKYVSMLSFRPGWGIVGNPPANEYLQYNRYANYGSYAGMGAINPENLRLTDLKWEKVSQLNLGANLGILNNLLSFNFDYYNKKTTDLLMGGVGIPGSTGYSTLAYRNVGSLRNEGWELYATTSRICKIGKFSLQLKANLSQNFNTILEMDPTVLATMNADFGYGNQSYLNRIQVGNAVGSIYGFRYQGVYRYDYDHNGYTESSMNTYGENTAAYQESIGQNASCPIARDANGNVITDARGNPLRMYYNYGGINYEFTGGDVMYEDVNHDGQINELDIVYLGNSNPKFYGGFGVDFFYGNWSLKTQFNFRTGNKIVNMARMNKENMRTNQNQSAAVAHRWRKNGDVTEIPRAMNSNVLQSYNALANDRYVEDGDFTRFQYLQVAYTFDTKKVKEWGLSSMRFAISANNLWFWTKYTGVDPEISPGSWGVATDGGTTPRAKSFTASLNVGF